MITVPKVKKIEYIGGETKVSPRIALSDEALRPGVNAFSEYADRVWGLSLIALNKTETDESIFTPLTESERISEDKGDDNAPFFAVKLASELSDGEYRITVNDGCLIEASGLEGLSRAASVLLQTGERTCDKYVLLPRCVVTDRPDSPFRALLLDVARRFHPIDYLYRYVDVCSLAGINRFIIHFTDDESYTLPCAVFPNLPTEGRCYTASEIAALDEYASSRGVMIIPEIDMPGHSAQFSTKYPEIFGKCGILEATEGVFSALEKIYAEASKLFPNSEFIHVGGDEAVLGRWNDSEPTIGYMKDNSISDVVALYGHFVGRVCRSVLSLGKTPIVWEGFGKAANSEVPRDVLVISWENHYQTADELVKAGFRILNASWRPLYCVAPWQKWSAEEILSFNKYKWNHWWEQSKAYDFGVSVPDYSPVDGGIYCAWGDYLKGYESNRLACELEFASVVPRVSALAEILWNDEPASFSDFSPSYEKLYSLFERIHGRNPFRGRL